MRCIFSNKIKITATIKWRVFKTRLSSPNHSLLDKPVLLPSTISIYLLSYFLNHQVCFVVVDKFLEKAWNVFANTSSEPLSLQALKSLCFKSTIEKAYNTFEDQASCNHFTEHVNSLTLKRPREGGGVKSFDVNWMRSTLIIYA